MPRTARALVPSAAVSIALTARSAGLWAARSQ
jgi:hypothetical protein